MVDLGKSKNEGGLFVNSLPFRFKIPRNAVGRKVLREYGALFIARGGAVAPKTVIFKNEREVSAFQEELPRSTANLGGFDIELQTAAMQNLKNAIIEAEENL